MKNKVSVIIPIYNGEKTLKQCLSSLMNQTYKNYEIVIVDNNSTDKTSEILNHYRINSKIPFQIIFESYRSRAAARNAGIKAAKGDIIIFSDCDCIFPNDWIEKLTLPIIKDNAIAVQGGEEPAIINFWTKQYQIQSDIDTKALRIRGYIDTKNFAIKKKILSKIGIFNPKMAYSDDIEFAERFFSEYNARYLPECKIRHYHPDSFSKIIRSNFWKGYYTSKIGKNRIALPKLSDKKSFSRLVYSIIQSASEKAGMIFSYII